MSNYNHSELHQDFFINQYHRPHHQLSEQEGHHRGEILMSIIDEGTINQRYNWNVSPQYRSQQQFENIRGSFIYKYNDDKDIYNDFTILELLCSQKDIGINIINYLLEYGAEPTGVTLSQSASNNRLDLLELLVNNGGNVNETVIRGVTPLQRCIDKNGKNIIKFIIRYKLNDNGYNYKHLLYNYENLDTFEQDAIKTIDIIEYLMAAGTNFNIRGTDGTDIWGTIANIDHKQSGPDYFFNFMIYLIEKIQATIIMQKYYRKKQANDIIKKLKNRREGLDRLFPPPSEWYVGNDDNQINMPAHIVLSISELRNKILEQIPITNWGSLK